MIVRLMGAGQYQVDDALLEQLNGVDDAAARALEAGDEAALREQLGELVRLVRVSGEPLDPSRLCASDLIVPPSDLSLAEAKELFSDEGLIPDLPD